MSTSSVTHTGRLMTMSLMGLCCLVFWKQHPETRAVPSLYGLWSKPTLRLCVSQRSGRR